MAIFDTSKNPKREALAAAPSPSMAPETALNREPDPASEFTFGKPAAPAATPVTAMPAAREIKESLIAADLSIEGKIQGAGHVRIAGRFKGDVEVEGDLTLEVGARLVGGVRARRVIIAGELEGNIISAERVELVQSGVMIGDIKAGTVTVAAGSRMRGQVEFGWSESELAPQRKGGRDSAAERDANA